MIFIDIDGPIIDFCGAARKFGIELELNGFQKWKWGESGSLCSGDINCPGCWQCYDHPKPSCPFPTPEKFYARAELQPWFVSLMQQIAMPGEKPAFITKDFAKTKRNLIIQETMLKDYYYSPYEGFRFMEAPDKSVYCSCPIDLLIDDKASECEAWREKGGIAHHFDLASDDPFKNFIQWWEMRK
jgi:hypothetical protein